MRAWTSVGGALNVATSILSRVLLLVGALVVRRLLIERLGNGVNGLNSLYASIISTLAVAELGIGSAIAYSMYRPIVEGDDVRLAALYRLHAVIYRVVGATIFLGGLLTMPFLPRLISDYDTLDANVYASFLLTLVSVCLTYLFAAKTTLMEAHKDNYLTTAIACASRLVTYVLQGASLMLVGTFGAYLACQVAGTGISWACTEVVARRRHARVLAMRASMDGDARSEVFRNARAMFMHKAGTVLVASVDSLVISGFVGVVSLGRYTNFTSIASVASTVVALFFTPLTSVVGHLCAEGDTYASKRWFERFHCLNFVLGTLCFLSYHAVAPALVELVFGADQQVGGVVVAVITLNQFTQCMRRTPLLFRDASGTFYNDRWKPIVEGVANLALSLVLVNVLPEEVRVAGVIVATILTTLTICDTVEPHVVFMHAFHASPRAFYVRNYAYILLFAACMLAVRQVPATSGVAGVALGLISSLVVSLVAFALLALVDKVFRTAALTFLRAVPTYARRLRDRLKGAS